MPMPEPARRSAGPTRSARVTWLATSVLAVSTSSILIRLADADPLAVGFYRNGIAAAVLLPIAVVRHREAFRRLSPARWRTAVASGAALAVHFAAWVPSLALTTVAASTVLVQTSPVWVAILGWVVLGERVRRRTALGIVLAFAGAALISGGDWGDGGRAVLGDLLALGGALGGAMYVLAGRRLRRDVPLLVYVGIVYAIAAVLLGGTMLLAGSPFAGFEPRVWLLLGLMALVPHLVGHTIVNYLLAHLEAVVVAVALLAEPVAASLLALAILREVPLPTNVLGGAIVLAGVYLAVTSRQEVTSPRPAA